MVSFYSVQEYEHWKREHTTEQQQWTIKYYKGDTGINVRVTLLLADIGCVCSGLGTSTMAEAKEYFRELEKHRSTFQWDDDVISGASNKLIVLKNEICQ